MKKGKIVSLGIKCPHCQCTWYKILENLEIIKADIVCPVCRKKHVIEFKL